MSGAQDGGEVGALKVGATVGVLLGEGDGVDNGGDFEGLTVGKSVGLDIVGDVDGVDTEGVCEGERNGD